MKMALKPPLSMTFVPPVGAVLVLTAVCFVSTLFLPFWFDELLTHYVVSDHSFTHMLGATGDLITASPPLYFILTWPLAQVFGATELPLRLYSSLGISAALFLTWFLLRRLYGAWPASAGVLVAFLGSQAIWYQNMEGRYYGMFLAEVAAAVLLSARLTSGRPTRWYLLAANVAIHAALVTTHYFGFFYSAAILLAVTLCLRRQRKELAMCVGTGLIGWLAFLPCIPMFLHHLEFNNPHGWMTKPGLKEVRTLVRADLLYTLPVAGIIAVCAVLIRRSRADRAPVEPPTADRDLSHARRNTGIVMLCLFCVPCAVWLMSMVANPMYLARYFLPDVLIWSFVYTAGMRFISDRSRAVADAATNALRAARFRLLPRIITTLVVCGYLTIPAAVVVNKLVRGKVAKFSVIPTLVKMPLGPAGEPVVFENIGDQLPVNYYSKTPNKYFAIVDHEAANDDRACRPANNLNQIAAALKRQYSELPIVTTDELLHRCSDFVVIDLISFWWFDRNIENQSSYSCEVLPPDKQDIERRINRILVHDVKPPVARRSAAEQRQ